MLASSLISQANGELIEEANSHMHTKEIGEGGMAMVYAHEHAIVPRDSVRASASFLRLPFLRGASFTADFLHGPLLHSASFTARFLRGHGQVSGTGLEIPQRTCRLALGLTPADTSLSQLPQVELKMIDQRGHRHGRCLRRAHMVITSGRM